MIGNLSNPVHTTDPRQKTTHGLHEIRTFASQCFIVYVWAMTVFIAVLTGFWSENWMAVGIILVGVAAAATFYQLKNPTKLQTRLVISVAMIFNWAFLVYASSGITDGEYILDSHMIYFIINAMLMAYFCPVSLLVANWIVVLHRGGPSSSTTLRPC